MTLPIPNRVSQDALEVSVAKFFGRSYCILTGSGTAAIYVVFEALELGDGARVLYPDLTCETALNGAVYAGLRPILSDVELSSGNLAIDAAVQVCRANDVRAVVATHLFGNIMDVESLRRALSDDGVFVLEDAAQAYGGQRSGVSVGRMGDASIVSFGAGKPLDCGGGGAVLTDSRDFYRRCSTIRDGLLMGASAGDARRKAFMKKFFLMSRESAQSPAELYHRKNELKREHKDGFLSQADPALQQAVRSKFQVAGEVFEHRRALAERIRQAVTSLPVTPLEARGDPVYWRYSFLCDRRDEVYDQLIRHGICASRFFAPLHRNYGLPDDDYPVASHCADQVINLHLDAADRIDILVQALEKGLAAPR